MKVRLYWHDGRQEDVEVVEPGTTVIVRQTPDGHRHFVDTGEEDDDGAERFLEENDDDT